METEMPRHASKFLLTLAFLIAASLVIAQGNAPPRYVSGGVGEESRAAMEEQAAAFNLRVVFADRSGAYVSGAHVAILDASGRQVLDVTTEGPWLFVALAPGEYRLRASIDGQPTERSFGIPLRGSRELVVRFEDAP